MDRKVEKNQWTQPRKILTKDTLSCVKKQLDMVSLSSSAPSTGGLKDQPPVEPMHVPNSAAGKNYYSKNLHHTKPWITESTQYVIEALNDMQDEIREAKGSFVMAEYGCADGNNSVKLFSTSIAMIRAFNEEVPIIICYEDRPENDFKSLFLMLQGYRNSSSSGTNAQNLSSSSATSLLSSSAPSSTLTAPSSSSASYLNSYSNVFSLTSAHDFYSACFPPNHLDVAYCAASLHWLSRRPCNLKRCLMHTDKKALAKEKEAFKEQAFRDYQTFLLRRAKELKPGGSMILCVLCFDDKNEETGSSKYRSLELSRNMRSLWVDQWQAMVNTNQITQEEFENTTFNVYFRDENELRQPFNDPKGPVSQAGLHLVSCNMKLFDCPLHKKWIALKQMKSSGSNATAPKSIAVPETMTAEERQRAAKMASPRFFAQCYIRAMKVFAYNTFMDGLAANRSKEDKVKIVETFLKNVEDVIAEDKDKYAINTLVGFLYIQKEKECS